MSWFYFHPPSREAELKEGGWRGLLKDSTEILDSWFPVHPAKPCWCFFQQYLLGSQAMLLLAALAAPTLTGGTGTGVGFPLTTSGTVDSLHLLLRKEVGYSCGYFRGKKSKLGGLKDFCSCHWVYPFCVSCKIAQTDPWKDSVLSLLYHNQYLSHKEKQCNNKHNKLVFRFQGVTVLKYIIIPLPDYFSNIAMLLMG